MIELVERLYKLPINGRKIREQLHDLINMQQKLNPIINPPQSSSLFQELKTILQNSPCSNIIDLKDKDYYIISN